MRKNLLLLAFLFFVTASPCLRFTVSPSHPAPCPVQNEDFAHYGAPTDGNDACRSGVSHEQIWTAQTKKVTSCELSVTG